MVIIIGRYKIRIFYSFFKNFTGVLFDIDSVKILRQNQKQLILFIDIGQFFKIFFQKFK